MQKSGLRQELINEICKLAEKYEIEQVILFGSRARGDAKEDSDWDLLLLLNKEKLEQSDYDEIVYPFTALGWDLGEMIIPVIYTMDEWKSTSFTPFYKNIEKEGKIIYESN